MRSVDWGDEHKAQFSALVRFLAIEPVENDTFTSERVATLAEHLRSRPLNLQGEGLQLLSNARVRGAVEFFSRDFLTISVGELMRSDWGINPSFIFLDRDPNNLAPVAVNLSTREVRFLVGAKSAVALAFDFFANVLACSPDLFEGVRRHYFSGWIAYKEPGGLDLSLEESTALVQGRLFSIIRSERDSGLLAAEALPEADGAYYKDFYKIEEIIR